MGLTNILLRVGVVAGMMVACTSPFPPTDIFTKEQTLLSAQVEVSQQDGAKEIERRYNVKLLFTGIGGIYLSNTRVMVRDTVSGRLVLSSMVCTPVLLVRLPAGTYHLDAMADGAMTTMNIQAATDGMRSYTIRLPVYGQHTESHTVLPRTPLGALLHRVQVWANGEKRCS